MSLSCSSYSSSSIKEVDQEAVAMAAAAENSHVTVKGKRTKRPRSHPQSPAFPLSATSTSSSTLVSSSGAEVSGSSSTVVTEEEEDMAMANCLILLAQGPAPSVNDPQQQRQALGNKFSYECKTCNKCFPTFQALGGHRASHKKPKTATDQEKPSSAEDLDNLPAASTASMRSTKQITNAMPTVRSTKQRLHECSICGLEFTSGQALGGHMRRHRPASAPEPAQENKEKSLLSLDLNLPAPEEADQDGGLFAFPSSSEQQQPILLVDCHY